jgi:excisionase family DNA binding protein
MVNTMLFREYDDIVSVEDVMHMLHIGRSAVYKLLNEEKIKTVKIGKKFIIPKRSIIEFVTIQ